MGIRQSNVISSEGKYKWYMVQQNHMANSSICRVHTQQGNVRELYDLSGKMKFCQNV